MISKKGGRPRRAPPGGWAHIRVQKKTRDVLKILSRPSRAIWETIDFVLIANDYMTKDHELSQTVRDYLKHVKEQKNKKKVGGS